MRVANQANIQLLTSTGSRLPDLHEQDDDSQQVGQITCQSKNVHGDGGIRCCGDKSDVATGCWLKDPLTTSASRSGGRRSGAAIRLLCVCEEWLLPALRPSPCRPTCPPNLPTPLSLSLRSLACSLLPAVTMRRCGTASLRTGSPIACPCTTSSVQILMSSLHQSQRLVIISSSNNILHVSSYYHKQKNSYEWYMPKGILKTSWVRKHLFEVPSVAVLFFELDFDDAKWAAKEEECVARVSISKFQLQEAHNCLFRKGGACPPTAERPSAAFSSGVDSAKCQSSW